MIIYDEVRKSEKIAVFSLNDDILDKVTDKILNEGYKVEKYNDIDKLILEVNKKKIKIIVYLYEKEVEVDFLKKQDLEPKIILAPAKKLDFDKILLEILYMSKLVEEEEKIDFQKYKLEMVGNLVESISHKVQSNLLVLGASQDIIKLIGTDLKENDEKKEVLESLYTKNSNALENSNMLLELVSNATAISNESIMQSSQIENIITAILDEYLKENDVKLKIEERIKKGSYICGPLNDVIFAICKTIKLLAGTSKKDLKLIIYEDENNWYFELENSETLVNTQELEQIRKFIVYVKNAKPKITNSKISIIIRKVK